jgi:hypothetical protein
MATSRRMLRKLVRLRIGCPCPVVVTRVSQTDTPGRVVSREEQRAVGRQLDGRTLRTVSVVLNQIGTSTASGPGASRSISPIEPAQSSSATITAQSAVEPVQVGAESVLSFFML